MAEEEKCVNCGSKATTFLDLTIRRTEHPDFLHRLVGYFCDDCSPEIDIFRKNS